MEHLKVKDMMVPLAEYATVSEDASLYDAVVALKKAQQAFNQERDRHRAVLVLDHGGHVIGKLSQMDLIRGLEPNYQKIGSLRETSRLGFSPEFMRSLIKSYGLWDRPLHELCKKAAVKKVAEIMYCPTPGEYVKEEDTLDQGIHQLIIGHHQSLLVMRGEQIVGVLRLSDVFREVCSLIESCSV